MTEQQDQDNASTELVPHARPNFEEARRKLEVTTTIDEVKISLDQIAAVRAFISKHEAQNLELRSDWFELDLRAKRRLGQLLLTRERGPKGWVKKNLNVQIEDIKIPPTLEELGISRNLAAQAQKLAKLEDKDFEPWRAGDYIELGDENDTGQ